mgnify:FL=1
MRVSLYKKNRVNKANLNPIMFQVTLSRGVQKRVSTPIAVKGKFYSNGQVSTKHPNHNDINVALRELRNKGEEAEQQFMVGKLNNMSEVVAFLNGRQNAESVDSFLHTILKPDISVANYDDNRHCLNGFKRLMGIKGDLMFNEVTNQLYARFHSIGKKEIEQGNKSPKTIKKYGQSVLYICRQAFYYEQRKERIDIYSKYLKFPKVDKEPVYHTWQEIEFAIKNTYTLEQWQSCALWLLMFGLRGINNVDIVNISDKLLKEIKEVRGKEKLVSVENKDFNRELYLDYKRSKTGVPMIISVFPPILTLIKYLKNTVVKTHIDKRCKNRGIIKGLEDRLNIFEYDSRNQKKFHRQLWKQRQNKFSVLSTDSIEFKNARSTFFQVAQSIYSTLDTKILVGHKMTDVTEAYASVRQADVIRKMNRQHIEVLKKYNYEKLVKTLVKQLYKLVGEDKAPNWVLANALSTNKYMLTIAVDKQGNIKDNVYSAVKIEDKYYKYFKNQKDIEVELPEFTPPEFIETETGEITFSKQEFEVMGLEEYAQWESQLEIGQKMVDELLEEQKKLKLIYGGESTTKKGTKKVS